MFVVLALLYIYIYISLQVLTATFKQGTVPEHVYLYLTLFISLLSIHVRPHQISSLRLLSVV